MGWPGRLATAVRVTGQVLAVDGGLTTVRLFVKSL